MCRGVSDNLKMGAPELPARLTSELMLWRVGSFVQYAAQYHHAPQTCDKLRLVSQYHLPTPQAHISSHPTMIYNLPGRILAGNTFLKILYFFVGIVMFCKCRIDSLATGVETV